MHLFAADMHLARASTAGGLVRSAPAEEKPLAREDEEDAVKEADSGDGRGGKG